MAGTPYNVDRDASSVASLSKNANQLTGIMLQLAQQQFSQADYIHHPQLKQYIWNSDIRQSKILVDHVWNWKLPRGDQRPAVLVRRNPLTFSPIAVGDGDSTHVDNVARGSLPISGVSHQQLSALGSHTLFCVSTLPAECELLAAEVATRLVMFGQVIRRDFDFNKFAVAEIGELFKIEEAGEYFGIPVAVAYRYVEAWQLESSAPFLKGVATELTFE